jgi:hypothetical protein
MLPVDHCRRVFGRERQGEGRFVAEAAKRKKKENSKIQRFSTGTGRFLYQDMKILVFIH